jgi:DNA-binding beta-propeller fold protein YncE
VRSNASIINGVHLLLIFATCVLCFTFTQVSFSAKSSDLHIVSVWKVPGEGGLWDYITADSENRRLYVTRYDRIAVLDLDSGAVVGEITGLKLVHGVAIASEFSHGFATDGDEASILMFDSKTLKTIQTIKIPGGGHPDGIVYDPVSKRVFTCNGRRKDTTVIDAETGSVIGTVDLDGRPEGNTVDGKGHVYFGFVKENLIDAVDTKNLKVIGRWPTAPCDKPIGLAVDPATNRLFAGCYNKRMIMLDGNSGKVLGDVPVGGGSDGAGFDRGPKLAFTSNGDDGTLSVVHEDSPGKITLLENVPTAQYARTMTIDEKTHRIFLPTANAVPQPNTPDGKEQLPKIAPGSFRIVVVGSK